VKLKFLVVSGFYLFCEVPRDTVRINLLHCSKLDKIFVKYECISHFYFVLLYTLQFVIKLC